jgi:starch-binding outer membrane protein, SusD/RagB family
MKSKIFITGIILFLLIGGCKKLDQEVITTLTYDQVIKSYDYVRYLNAGIYTNLMNGFLYVGDAAMLASATDEAEHTLETATVQKFNVGAWNAFDNPDNVWSNYFVAIRRANVFLASADSVNLDIYKFDPTPAQQTVWVTRVAELKRMKYEARFLRAYFYFELIKRYGGVPILTSAGPITGDNSDVTRNTLAECIQFISDECDSTAAKLPLTYPAADLGRATKGAAMALKSRLLLYSASDLWNSPSSWAPGYANPELISVNGDRTAKWLAAANAAKAVIDLAGTSYALGSNYGSLFGSGTFNNAEIIFRRGNSNSNTFELANTPIGYDLGQSGTTPSGNLVDDYEVKVNATTAVPFDWTNPIHAANPYAPVGTSGRDPRLAFTVLLNNAVIKGRAVQAYLGGLDGKPTDRATKTGYYLNKYNNTSLTLLTGQTSNHSWIIFRLAEMYLNYAEALNEASPGDPDIKIYVDKVRQRASVVMPVLPGGLSQEQMRAAIRHERRIEFAFEDHRAWDVRRWMLGDSYFNVPLKGVSIIKNTDGTFTYQPVNVENRVFQSKMYFYPIPQSELNITGWPQNPIW